jgi:hypothetical protein
MREEPSPTEGPPPSGEPPSGPPRDEYGATEPGVAPGLDGRPVYTMPGVLAQPDAPSPAPTRPPGAPAVDRDAGGKALRETLRGRDKAIGIDLPAAGTVASAVADAVRAANTPNVSRATFEVRLGPDGRVLGVRVVRANAGDAASWARAAELVASRIAKRLVMGALSAGATIFVDVVSDVEMPAGDKGGFNPTGATFDLSNIGAHAARVVRTSFQVVPTR